MHLLLFYLLACALSSTQGLCDHPSTSDIVSSCSTLGQGQCIHSYWRDPSTRKVYPCDWSGSVCSTSSTECPAYCGLTQVTTCTGRSFNTCEGAYVLNSTYYYPCAWTSLGTCEVESNICTPLFYPTPQACSGVRYALGCGVANTAAKCAVAYSTTQYGRRFDCEWDSTWNWCYAYVPCA